MNIMPPPVIDSAKLLFFAHNDDTVQFTDRINLHIGRREDFERLGEMPCLAICSNYNDPTEILLLFCDQDWESKGVISFGSVEEAKLKAERGYKGISGKWQVSPYSEEEVRDYLRDEYEVDPDTEWWKTICSFCGKDQNEVDGMIVGQKATVCRECVETSYKLFQDDGDA
jgi:hypothetical protein